MDRRSRVVRLFNGQAVDRTPFSFSKHFPADFAYGAIGIKNHMDFYHKSKVDILKIMNEHLMPYVGLIQQPSDWLKVKDITRNHYFISEMVKFVSELMEQLDEPCFTMVTVHGIIACTIHLSMRRYGYYDARKIHSEHCRQSPVVMRDVHLYITELLLELIRQCSRAGIDSVYYASLGGDNLYLHDSEFAELVAPFEIEILKQAQENFGLKTVLHMCKDHLSLPRYSGYAPFADAVNWGVHENNIPLREGCKIFADNIILGGMSHQDPDLLSGNIDGIKQKIDLIKSEIKEHRFILGADCTLPAHIDNCFLADLAKILD